ncbi:putative UDP-glucuronate 4-epimerase [Helianthus annuus]|uniref:Putative bifunctional polymyxin resistance protein, ArnA n=1 Tax=Helianthus annuus TaxID=4232 RepID=A0A251SX69_HELAN|nr:putative UDP-glucuronate 4-epimerase [Helianthus annuus]
MGVTVKSSVNIGLKTGYSVLVTVAAGFVGIHISAALRCRGDYVLGLDNFNSYYDPTLKRVRQHVWKKSGIFIVEGDIKDTGLLNKLFEVVHFPHVIYLAAQAGVRYAMKKPKILYSYTLFGKRFRKKIEQILYAATKKAGEEIAHTYNHIYGLSLTGLRFFTVYGPWGRLDMAYFFFSKDILKRKSIPIFESSNHGTVAHDFTFIDDVVKGCLGALDATEKSTGSGNTSPVPVSELVSILEKLLKVKVKAIRRVMKLPRIGDVPFTHANISLAQREFGV